MKSCKLHFVAHRENVPVALEVEWKKSSQENEGPHCVCVGRPSSTTRSDGSKKGLKITKGFFGFSANCFFLVKYREVMHISNAQCYYSCVRHSSLVSTGKLALSKIYNFATFFFPSQNFNVLEFQFLVKISVEKKQLQVCRSRQMFLKNPLKISDFFI